MIKVQTLGMYDVAKNNPVLTSASDVNNYSFLVNDGDAYVIMQSINGDDSYKEGIVIKAGNPLNGFQLEAWEGQKLIIDGKHIDGTFATVSVTGTILVIDNATGKIKVGTAPTSGAYFVVKGTTTLTEAAVIAKVVVA
jgi:hypothetical protein